MAVLTPSEATGWGSGLGRVRLPMREVLRFGVTVLTDACIRWVRERLRCASLRLPASCEREWYPLWSGRRWYRPGGWRMWRGER